MGSNNVIISTDWRKHICIRIMMLMVVVSLGSMADEAMLEYDIFIKINPRTGHIDVRSKVIIDSSLITNGSLQFVLHKNLEVSQVTSSTSCRYQHSKESDAPYRYAPDAVSLTVTFNEPPTGQTVELGLDYSGKLTGDKWGTNIISPEWLEIGQYTAWFPLLPAEKFEFRIEVQIPSDYRCIGNGRVIKDANCITIHSVEPVSDMIVIASPHLEVEKKEFQTTTVYICHQGMNKESLRNLNSDIHSIMNTYKEWFSETHDGFIYLIASGRSRGGGYSRPQLVSLTGMDDYQQTPGRYKYLAHELAHIYWRNAPTSSWEDWLNESFAEYSAILCVWKNISAEASSAILNRYRSGSSEIQAIKGIDRNSEGSYDALYKGGPLILENLRNRVGDAGMIELLREVSQKRISSTEDLLSIVEKMYSFELSLWLNNQLETGNLNVGLR